MWSGYSGTFTSITFRVTFFFAPIVVVVLRMTSVTLMKPQRSAWASLPVTVFLTTVTFFFGVAARAWSAATVLATDEPSAATPAIAGSDLCMSSLLPRLGVLQGEAFDVDVAAADPGGAQRCARGPSVIAGGPQR